MRHRLMFGVMCVAGLAGSACAQGTRPTTAPATRPTADIASIKRLVTGLADNRYETREACRIELMGLKRTELGMLRDAVKMSLPLEPDQVNVLRDIVMQIYLAGDDYETEPGAFLGISLAGPMREETQGLLSINRGVAVVSCVPGFCAYRMLQSGDVILSMTTGDGKIVFESPDPEERFRPAVMAVGPGNTVTFEVLRQGRIISVPLTLDRRPRGVENSGFIQQFTNDRAVAAEAYWKKDFASLLNEPVG